MSNSCHSDTGTPICLTCARDLVPSRDWSDRNPKGREQVLGYLPVIWKGTLDTSYLFVLPDHKGNSMLDDVTQS